MSPRDAFRRLIDDLPEAEIPRAEREVPSFYTLENAPIDNEPETPEEAAAVAEAWREHRAGKSLRTEELKREFGLP